jgi:transglutaminase-like putative cysteine protease
VSSKHFHRAAFGIRPPNGVRVHVAGIDLGVGGMVGRRRWAYDPTNDAVPGTGHVVIARGRDYDDVTPVRGIYHGGDGGSADVEVEVTRLR